LARGRLNRRGTKEVDGRPARAGPADPLPQFLPALSARWRVRVCLYPLVGRGLGAARHPVLAGDYESVVLFLCDVERCREKGGIAQLVER
jgi:hypothetical protein